MFENEINTQQDRITEILRQQSASMRQPPQMPANLLNAMSLSSMAGGGSLTDKVMQYGQQQQEQELGNEASILKIFEAKKAAGDANAQALDGRISLFTGGDPEGTALFLEELHNDPEEIDPSNSFQIMTKLAGIAKRTGYKSPILSMEMEKKQLENEKTRASIRASDALAGQRGGGGNSTNGGGGTETPSFGKPPSGYRWLPDGSLEPIPGGPGTTISAELAARLGLAQKTLKEMQQLKQEVIDGTATGFIDNAAGNLGIGKAGGLHRRIADGADALQRMLTGAGMPASEAADYTNRFKPTFRDTTDSLLDKLNNMEAVLMEQTAMATRGRGGSPTAGEGIEELEPAILMGQPMATKTIGGITYTQDENGEWFEQ